MENNFTPQEQYEIMVKYLDLMRQQRDWHGVRDACTDIEVLLAKYPEIKE